MRYLNPTGGPAMTPAEPEKTTDRVTLRLPAALTLRLDEYARRLSITRSEAIRLFIERSIPSDVV